METLDQAAAGISREPKQTGWVHLVYFLLVFVYTLPFILPMLGAYFTGDDLLNLHYHTERSFYDTLSHNLTFWSTYRRPMGGVLYLTLYNLFGMNSVPYYGTGLALFSINLVLLYIFVARLTGSGAISAFCTALASIHTTFIDVWFNFGAVYELLSFTFMFASLHCYLSYRRNFVHPRRFYWLSFVFFVAALNAKEMAVTIPLVIGLFELLYRMTSDDFWTRMRQLSVRMLPFLMVGTFYTIGKIFAEGSRWSENPLYRFQFDFTFYRNLGAHLSQLLYNSVELTGLALFVALVVSLGLALILHNRHMLFGWGFFLITLLPVLALPRSWGLFLYIPVVGLGLYLSVLGWEVVQAVRLRFPLLEKKSWVPKIAPILSLILLLLVLGALHHQSFAKTRSRFLNKSASVRTFSEELRRKIPEIAPGTALIVEEAPLGRYHLRSLVQLTYRTRDVEIFTHRADYQLRRRDNYSCRFWRFRRTMSEVGECPCGLRPVVEQYRSILSERNPDSDAAATLNTLSVPFLENSELLAGLTIHGVDDEPSSLQVRLKDSDGRTVTDSRVISVDPGEHSLTLIRDLLSPTAVNSLMPVGSLDITIPRAVPLKIVYFSDRGPAEIAAEALRRKDRTLVFPNWVQGEGVTSSLLVYNPGSSAASGTIEIRDKNGVPLQTEINGEQIEGTVGFFLNSQGTASWVGSGDGNLQAGWLRVVSDQPVRGLLIVRGLNFGTGVFPASPAISSFSVEGLVSSPESSRHTGLAILNTSDAQVEVQLELPINDRNPFEAGAIRLSIQPQQRWAEMVGNLWSFWPRELAETLRVRSTGPIRFTAVQMDRSRNRTLLPRPLELKD